MKKQVNFAETAEGYIFSSDDDIETNVFMVDKDTLIFNTNDFYEHFFKGLSEKPEYTLSQPIDELKGKAKHVYDTVAAIFKKACVSIEESWFQTDDIPEADAVLPNEHN